MNTFGLSEHTITKINSVFANYYQIEKVIIYGSRAKGNYKNGSDIDLTMVGEDITYTLQVKIYGELDDLLLPYTIDLSVYGTITNTDLKEHIDRVGQIFYIKSRFMPVVSMFYGIVIKMFFEEHNPPNFHVEYAEHKAVVDIGKLQIIKGKLPRRAEILVLDWAELHQQELMEDWGLCQHEYNPNPIKPLK